MIEYITETGMFGLLWIFSFIMFIGISYRFIKTNKLKAIPVILPMVIGLFIVHHLAIMLMGKSSFDTALIFIKDMWFLMGHVMLITVFISLNKSYMEFWKPIIVSEG